MLRPQLDWTRGGKFFFCRRCRPVQEFEHYHLGGRRKRSSRDLMDQKASPGVQLVKAATQAEIIAAMESLGNEDSERLEQVAINRVIRIGRKAANGRSHEDLLQEAMERTLERRRIWYPEQVTFVPFLIGVVWSIASEWAGRRERNPRSPEYA